MSFAEMSLALLKARMSSCSYLESERTEMPAGATRGHNRSSSWTGVDQITTQIDSPTPAEKPKVIKSNIMHEFVAKREPQVVEGDVASGEIITHNTQTKDRVKHLDIRTKLQRQKQDEESRQKRQFMQHRKLVRDQVYKASCANLKKTYDQKAAELRERRGD